jgi:hypothetical protein
MLITSFSELAVYAGKECYESRHVAGRFDQCLVCERMVRKGSKLLFERISGRGSPSRHAHKLSG